MHVSRRGYYKISDMHTDVHGTPYHVSEHCKINMATALEVHSCTCPVELTRACRSTILSLRIAEKGLYCSCVSVELRSDNFAITQCAMKLGLVLDESSRTADSSDMVTSPLVLELQSFES